MTSRKWSRLTEIFDTAVKKPREARREFVQQQCGADHELFEELVQLLDAHERDAGFFDTPALGAGFHADQVRPGVEAPVVLPPGVRVGRYEIESLLGAGGMSVVYRAKRADADFHQTVALKLIKPSDRQELLAQRIRLEREVLAQLDHPNIAKLLDGGATDDGLPYLVMEYIQGKTLGEYCSAERLDIVGRLRLFQTVCEAVNYAHRNLILHRDLKPVNIVVTEHGVPKLLDFGIAKLLRDTAAGETLSGATTTQPFFTPEYASPEQIRGEVATTATDVYSLGVVLCELLTGYLPHRRDRGPFEYMRAVCEEEPTRPSQVVRNTDREAFRSGSSARAPDAGSSRSEVEVEAPAIRRLQDDLDHIVLKALRKAPESRYLSARELADDIQRHLDGRPVLARRGTLRYRLSRYVRRNRARVAVSLVVLLLLAMLGQAWVREARRRELNRQAHEAESFVLSLSRRDVVKSTVDRWAETIFDERFRREPEVMLRFTNTVGHVCDRFHLRQAAVIWRRKALTAAEAVVDEPKLVEATWNLGHALVNAGRWSEADALLTRAEEANSRLTPAPRVEPLRILHDRGRARYGLGDYVGAEAAFNRGRSRIHSSALEEALPLLLDHAELLHEQGREGEAEEVLSEAWRLSAGRPVQQAVVRMHLSDLRWSSPNFSEAELLLRSALDDLRSQLPQRDPRVSECLRRLAVVVAARLGTRLAEQRVQVAGTIWRRAHENLRAQYGEDSLVVSESLHSLTELVPALVARTKVHRALEIAEGYYPPTHPRIGLLRATLGAHMSEPLSRGEEVTASLRVGEEHLREALRLQRERGLGDSWQTGLIETWLAQNLTLQHKRLEEAEDLTLRGYRKIVDCHGEAHPSSRMALQRIANLYDEWGRSQDARRYRDRLDSIPSWPYGRVIRDDDGSAEREAEVNFEDDHIEKLLLVPSGLDGKSRAVLWIYAKPANYTWEDFHQIWDFRLQVNDQASQTIPFDIGIRFLSTEDFQWVPFEISLDWLREGSVNRFVIFERHDPDYERNQPWTYNNLAVGVDTDRDYDRSWWFGSGNAFPCCEEIGIASMKAEKPLARDSDLFREHRTRGLRECQGELMIFLELR